MMMKMKSTYKLPKTALIHKCFWRAIYLQDCMKLYISRVDKSTDGYAELFHIYNACNRRLLAVLDILIYKKLLTIADIRDQFKTIHDIEVIWLDAIQLYEKI